MAIKPDKEFIILDGEVIEIISDLAKLKIEDRILEVSLIHLPKNVKQGDAIKMTLSTPEAFEKKIEGNAKKILNEILGN